jgi:hypothetical protein
MQTLKEEPPIKSVRPELKLQALQSSPRDPPQKDMFPTMNERMNSLLDQEE